MAVDVLDVFGVDLRNLERPDTDFATEPVDERVAVAPNGLFQRLVLVRHEPAAIGVVVLVALDSPG